MPTPLPRLIVQACFSHLSLHMCLMNPKSIKIRPLLTSVGESIFCIHPAYFACWGNPKNLHVLYDFPIDGCTRARSIAPFYRFDRVRFSNFKILGPIA